MKQSLLSSSAASCRKQCRMEITVCVILVCATLILNILICLLRTDSTHTLLLLVNILTDTACGWYVIRRTTTKISVMRRLLLLTEKPCQSLCGIVERISGDTRRIPGLDCYVVSVSGRKLYLPTEGCIRLEEGECYRLCIADNVIVEAEQ